MSDEQNLVYPGFLETLISMSKDMASGLSVSVMVGGKWLTGEITTERAFLEHAVERLSTSAAPIVKADPATLTARLKAGAFKHLFDQPLREESGILPEFLFLRSVSVIDGGSQVHLAEQVLRIRMDAIAVVQLGRMAIAE